MRFQLNTIAIIPLLFLQGCLFSPKKIIIEERAVVTTQTPMIVMEEKTTIVETYPSSRSRSSYPRSKKNKKLMRDLDDLLFVQLDSEFNREESWIIEKKKHILSILDEFISKSKKITAVAPPELRTEEYIAMANELDYKANLLKGLIKSNNTSKISKGISMITGTCNRCHDIYQ